MNKLYKSLIYDGFVSLSVLDTTELVNDAIKIHNLDSERAKTLGGLLTCAAYMSGCLKSDKGAVSITVKSNGDSSTVSVSGDINLHIRGYIDGDGTLSGGTMTVIKDDGLYRPFIGTCELTGNDVSQNLMNYFDKSEQIPTAISFGVEMEGGKCVKAGGVVMQLLPGYTDEIMELAEEKMQSFVEPCKVLKELGADGIMKEHFKDIDEKSIYVLYPVYQCNCTRKKIESVILPLGEEELLKTQVELGSVKVHCHYCNTDYEFTRDDIKKLFN